jgi:hypothetical protein
LPSSLHISIAYREFLADNAPVTGSDPASQAGAGNEAGTWVEGYILRVEEGDAPDVSITYEGEIVHLVESGQLHAALRQLTVGACPPDPDDPGVVLANVAVAAGGSLNVDTCRPRRIVPTNQLLMQLAAYLARPVTTKRQTLR